MKEADIVYESGCAWVYRNTGRKADPKHYTVFVSGHCGHSESDSHYELSDDGLSIAKARADYLASRLSARS